MSRTPGKKHLPRQRKSQPPPPQPPCALSGHSLGLMTQLKEREWAGPLSHGQVCGLGSEPGQLPTLPSPSGSAGKRADQSYTTAQRTLIPKHSQRAFPISLFFCFLSGCGWRICFLLDSEEAMIHEALHILRYLRARWVGWEGRPTQGL